METIPKTWLFVPGARPDRFAKAMVSGADALILDLEDAVAIERKLEARNHIRHWLTSGAAEHRAGVAVRINPLGGQNGLRDLLMLAECGRRLDFLMVPKAEEPAELALVARLLDDAGSEARIVALVEGARGIARAAKLALATPRLAALAFGAADYAADLGQQVDRFRPDHARATLVNAAAAGGLVAIDSPFFDVADGEALAADCAQGRAIGFHGKMAIHPAQLGAIDDAFAASPEERERARRILASYHDGVGLLEGRMVDVAMVRWARRVA